MVHKKGFTDGGKVILPKSAKGGGKFFVWIFRNRKDIEKDLYFLLIGKSRGHFLLYFKITHLPWVEPSLRI